MIIYTDENIIAVNKKCGIPVQTGKIKVEALKTSLENEFGTIYTVHRLDTPVSGIVIFGRTKEAAASLSRQFSSNSVIKKYLCAVDNPPPESGGRLVDNIHVPSGNKANKVYIRQDADKSTKKASLKYRVIGKTDNYHLLEIILETGRRHQIRAQLSARGCHIKGDVKYGSKRTNRGGGIHLHALSLEFTHPSSGRRLFLEAALPEDPVWAEVKLTHAGYKPGADQQKGNNK
jgi:23S rRNA pseudouridine1911/1915/1917 synthase